MIEDTVNIKFVKREDGGIDLVATKQNFVTVFDVTDGFTCNGLLETLRNIEQDLDREIERNSVSNEPFCIGCEG